MLGSRVRHFRRAKKMTQPQLAKSAGIAQSAVSGIETGEKKNPGIETVKALAKALGVSVADLLDGEEEGKR